MKLSIVTTMYHSAPYLAEFHRRSRAAAEQLTSDIEFLYVNDGSPDNALERVLQLQEADPSVRVVDLSRNFGQHKAIMTGLEHARGDLVFLLDCDLEEEPELLTRFHAEYQATECDVVYGVQQTRKGCLWERFSGALFYRLFNMLSAVPIPRNAVTARLMSRRYVQALVQHRERELLLAGLWVLTGFVQKPCPVTKHSKGSTTYSLRKKMTQIVNAITSFSILPLLAVFYTGLLIMLLSMGGAGYLIVRRLFFDQYLAGWPSLMVTICFLGGLTVLSVGIVGIYLSRVFIEVKQRPYVVIRQLYESAQPGVDRENPTDS